MVDLELGDKIFSWNGPSEILDEKYFQVSALDKIQIVELESDNDLNGVVLVGKVSIVVDTIVYSQSHGAIGETTEFLGSSLAILGLKLYDLQQFLSESNNSNDIEIVRKEANRLISKFKDSITNKTTNINFENDSDVNFIIFGKNDLFLLGSADQVVLIHKKKVSVRKGEDSLVQVDPQDGITITNKEKCIRLGSQRKGTDFSFLGELGVNIASKVLDSIIWEND